jgi:hypothetical protein
LPRFSVVLLVAAAACASPQEPAKPPARDDARAAPAALGKLPATYQNTPSCPACLALTITLRPDGAYFARERVGNSEFYDFGAWKPGGEGIVHLAGGRDAPRRYAVRAGDLLDAQEGTQGGDLKRAAEVEALRGPFRMTGLYNGTTFKECRTGLAWRLDQTRTADALREDFDRRQVESVLVAVDGRLEAQAQGRVENLRVLRTASILSQRGCPG